MRQTLAEKLPIGVVSTGVGHAVGDLGREQALDGCERGDGECGAEEVAHLGHGHGGERGRGKRVRQRADVGDVGVGNLRDDGGDRHREQGSWK